MIENNIRKELVQIKKNGLYRVLKKNLPLSLIHNDYLNVSMDPLMKSYAHKSLKKFGHGGSGGSRLLGGNHPNCIACEDTLASFFGSESALLFSSGYLANVGVISALSPLFDEVWTDASIHASMIDGLRGYKKKIHIFNHGINVYDFDAKVQQTLRYQQKNKKKMSILVLLEGVYSMKGDCSSFEVVRYINRMAKEKELQFVLIMDETHSAGVFQEEGLGLFYSLLKDNPLAIRVLGFGKAFGLQGGAVVCSNLIKEYLIQKARTFIFQTALPPFYVDLIEYSVKTILKKPTYITARKKLWKRSEDFRKKIGCNNYDVVSTNQSVDSEAFKWANSSPIIFLTTTNKKRNLDIALRFSKNMQNYGIDVRPIRYPTVRLGEEGVRISMNLRLSDDEFTYITERAEQLWTEYLS